MHTITTPQRLEPLVSDVAPRHPPLQDGAERTALLDRLALRIALALLLWSTRPVSPATSPEIARRRRAENDRELREQAWCLRHARLPLL